MSFLLIDIGNTFLKWGLYAAPQRDQDTAQMRVGEHDRVLLDEIPMVMSEWRGLPCPDRIVIASVAGTRVVNPVLRALEVWPGAPIPHWISSRAQQCGVTNGYLNPAALGCDRWAAMIGTRALIGECAALVVVCGTATTLDMLTPDGRFLGGGIMPGLGLMQRALHQNTATLPDAAGDYVDFPRHTVDAIATGCAHAQAGAVERVFSLHQHSFPDARCILSGGAARSLGPRLTIASTHVANLVLEGLYRIALTLGGERSPVRSGSPD